MLCGAMCRQTSLAGQLDTDEGDHRPSWGSALKRTETPSLIIIPLTYPRFESPNGERYAVKASKRQR